MHSDTRLGSFTRRLPVSAGIHARQLHDQGAHLSTVAVRTQNRHGLLLADHSGNLTGLTELA
jgi:hypothetical protein